MRPCTSTRYLQLRCNGRFGHWVRLRGLSSGAQMCDSCLKKLANYSVNYMAHKSLENCSSSMQDTNSRSVEHAAQERFQATPSLCDGHCFLLCHRVCRLHLEKSSSCAEKKIKFSIYRNAIPSEGETCTVLD